MKIYRNKRGEVILEVRAKNITNARELIHTPYGPYPTKPRVVKRYKGGFKLYRSVLLT